MRKHGFDVHLLMAIKSLYCQPEVCVLVNSKQSKSFRVGVCLRQGRVLSLLLFIIYMNWMDKLSRTNECVTIKNYKSNQLLFADNLVLLTSSESGLQHALNGFAAACDIAEAKISTSNIEVLQFSRNPFKFSRNPVEYFVQVSGVSLKQEEKFKYLRVPFTSDGRQDEELDVRSGKASAVMRALHQSVVLKPELSRKTKLSMF